MSDEIRHTQTINSYLPTFIDSWCYLILTVILVLLIYICALYQVVEHNVGCLVIANVMLFMIYSFIFRSLLY